MKDKVKVREYVFHDLPRVYEPINKLMSMGTDVFMRWYLSRALPKMRGKAYLEIGVGTGEQFIFLKKHHDMATLNVGLDFTPSMIHLARKKIPDGHYVIGDAESLPFRDSAFQSVVSSFFVRYYTHHIHGYKERYRVLIDKGVSLDLDMGKNENNWFYPFVKFYIQYFMPKIGFAFAFPFGAASTYTIITQTHQNLPPLKQLLVSMKKAGFTHLKSKDFFFGLGMMYGGIKRVIGKST